MMHALVALLLLAAPAAAFAQSPTEFDDWNRFGVGTTATLEMVSDDGKSKVTTIEVFTLKKKEADKITLSGESVTEGTQKDSGERVISKEKKRGECKTCKKLHKEATLKEKGKEKLKIGSKEIEATIVETTTYGCEEKEAMTYRSWLSKDVPGGLLKMEATSDGFKVTVTLKSFEIK